MGVRPHHPEGKYRNVQEIALIMKRIAVIKVGQTFESLKSREGDFQDWIISGMGIRREEARIIDVCDGDPLPVYPEISGIVITGSHEMVTEHQIWSEKTADWLPEAVEGNIPILGICYGHQLLAHAMGGEVGDNPRGREFGTVEVKPTPQAKTDSLLGGLPFPLRVHVCHTQSVLVLPPKAVLLASSMMDPHQAFAMGECAWGVQFHPEFNAHIGIHYIEAFRKELKEEGKDPDTLIETCDETPCGGRLLRRFARIVREREGGEQ